jgi:DNA processing protein
MENKHYWLALNLIPGIGSNSLYRLAEHFDSPEDIFSASAEELAQVEGLTSKIAEKVKVFDWRPALDKELDLIERYGISIVTLEDSEYPENLKSIFDPPLALYVMGDLAEQDKYSIAIVGTRRNTAYGKIIAEQFARQLAERGLTIVSGMARGIDSISHRGALDGGGRTIAVLGCGLDVIYPPENHQLMQRIAESGAVISEFPLSTPPNSYNFPRRNRIISGLSLGVVVVEAALQSGTMITVGCALEQGREVFAVPGQITSKYSRGTNHMIKQGAKLAENVDDILEELKLQLWGMEVKKSAETAKTKAAMESELTLEEKSVLEVIPYDLIHIDEVIINADMPVNKILGIMMSLELKGQIMQAPGKMFCRRD